MSGVGRGVGRRRGQEGRAGLWAHPSDGCLWGAAAHDPARHG